MDRIVLITGSTDGIGKQTALDLAQKGYHVLVHGKNREKGMAVVSEIKRQTNNNSVDLLIADLSRKKEIKGLRDEVFKRYDHLDVLINNAGTGKMSSIIDIDKSDIDSILDINLRGTIYATKLIALPPLSFIPEVRLLSLSLLLATADI